MSGYEVAALLLTLVKAGFNFAQLVHEANAIYAAGGKDSDVSKFLKDKRDAAMKALQEIAEG